VVVAVIAVWVVEMTAHQVVDVSIVRHALVAAGRAVHVFLVVSAASMVRRARRPVRRVGSDRVLVDVVPVGMVQVAFVQIVGMAVVDNGSVTAAGSMNVGMSFVRAAGSHAGPFLKAVRTIVRHAGVDIKVNRAPASTHRLPNRDNLRVPQLNER
jgi:hypothetical protein